MCGGARVSASVPPSIYLCIHICTRVLPLVYLYSCITTCATAPGKSDSTITELPATVAPVAFLQIAASHPTSLDTSRPKADAAGSKGDLPGGKLPNVTITVDAEVDDADVDVGVEVADTARAPGV